MGNGFETPTFGEERDMTPPNEGADESDLDLVVDEEGFISLDKALNILRENGNGEIIDEAA
ncbi:MAG: hypothetical protein WA051_03105 [Minisyncoccia bacterium]